MVGSPAEKGSGLSESGLASFIKLWRGFIRGRWRV